MPQQANLIPLIIQMGLIFAVMYFIWWKPEQKQRKQLQDLRQNLKKNDEVVTAAGIHGTVVNVKETTVVLRLDENCRVEFDKEAVLTVVKKEEQTH